MTVADPFARLRVQGPDGTPVDPKELAAPYQATAPAAERTFRVSARALLDGLSIWLVACGLGVLDAAAWGAFGTHAGMAALGASLVLLGLLLNL